ncbi:acetyl-CoA carboxylase biotin carboxyl carrier protein subunit [Mesonia aestuariivivens]|uniref:Acetyl-CoA carboxylase biotin carboxyl carrier protein subunit n=1 Tax=Mesonia aestuariivivens TaxID=2796128 RepID=A0ABS6W1P2_9FLAO|nr:acetyl-CoA carboxylase biotin carboxyl carrier protein subunit [Mesonia aestuariivivens]MBW2961472.1 acetyl-CoA carboxylase biotin carboxyl carrier protein subunit [Mesonia aestuariivivens]
MNQNYKVKVNNDIELEFKLDEIKKLDIQPLPNKTYHLLKDHQSFKAEIIKSDFLNRKYTVKINSNHYEIDIASQLDLLIKEMGLLLGNAQKVNDIKAPMPGLILEINVKEGDTVKEGDYLLVLEAMKMENALTAPRDAIIKSISIEKGQTVEKNQLLIEME